MLALARGEEIRAAFLVFFDPFLREAAVADFREDFAHFFACLPGDDARTGRIVALFGGITDGIAHVAEATAVDQVDDELEFVQAFEISDLGLVACFCQRFETCFDQFTDAAAEYGLFAKKVGFSLFGKSGFKNAGARAAESFGVRKSERFCGTACIPFDGEKRRGSAALPLEQSWRRRRWQAA